VPSWQVRLAVAGAFHTSFMEPAVSRLEAALAKTEIRIPRIPVISNVNAQPHTDPDTIKKTLARQVPVKLVCPSCRHEWEITESVMQLAGYVTGSVGNNSEDPSNQGSEEKL